MMSIHPAPALPHDLHLNTWPETNDASLMEQQMRYYWLAMAVTPASLSCLGKMLGL